MLFFSSLDNLLKDAYTIFKKMFNILRQSPKHAYFRLGVQFPLKGAKPKGDK